MTRRLLVIVAGLVLLSALGMRIWNSQHSGLMYDEPVTLHLARSVAAGQLPFVDFYEHHSPLPWYALAPLASSSVWRLQRLSMALAGALGLLGLFLLARSAWGERVALIALVLGAVSPLWNRQGNMIIHDAVLVVMLTGALTAWWFALQRSSLWRWLLAGFCGGLVLLCKQTGILPVLAMGLGVLCFTRSLRALLVYILGGMLPWLPWLILYRGQYESLFNGLLGWNLAANAHLTANLKFTPFFSDIFWAHPLLWATGILVGLVACRHFLRRFDQGDPRPLTAVAGLTVTLILIFNWLLSKQTFGQYYLQAVPPLVLLAAPALDRLLRRSLPTPGRIALGVIVIYLGVVSPLMISSTPWTPDLEEKLSIARWLQENVKEEVIWEPWVYYAHLAGKQFTFRYPFLSIHSVRDDPSLPFITGEKQVPLGEYLDKEDVQWVVVHDPLMPGVDARLDRIFTAGLADWQIVRSFQVTRYASENGFQRSLWTPWWKPIVFYETVTVWRRHPLPRQAGVVGELVISNPADQPYLFLQVLHPGGEDVYLLDKASMRGKRYDLRWHQTGHAFFVSGEARQQYQQSEPAYLDQLIIMVSFSDTPEWASQEIYQVRLPADSDGRFCAECADTWLCRRWGGLLDPCERADISKVVQLSGTTYEALPGGDGD